MFVVAMFVHIDVGGEEYACLEKSEKNKKKPEKPPMGDKYPHTDL